MEKNIGFPTLSVDLVEVAKRSDGVLSTLDEKTIALILERYVNFLVLRKKYPEAALSPTYDIDEMWHLHMLCPRNYYADCMNYFGYILDHNAGFGKEASEAPVLRTIFDETQALWSEEFQDDYHVAVSAEVARKMQFSLEQLQVVSSRETLKTCISQPAHETQSLKTCFSQPAHETQSLKTCISQHTADTQSLKTCFSQPANEIQSLKTCFSQPAAETQSLKTCFSQPAAETQSLKTCISQSEIKDRSGKILQPQF